MKLSIIILTCDKDKYNVSNVIKQIKSNAKTGNYEILIADNTTQGMSCDFATVVSMGMNARQARARWTVAFYAKGDYLWFVDADDEVLDVPDVQSNVDLIVFNYKRFSSTIGTHNADKDFYFKGQRFLWNKWIKKDVYLKECSPLKDRNISFFEDVLACALLDKAKLTIDVCNTYIYNYKPSLTEKKYFDNANDFITWCGDYIEAVAVMYNYFTDEQRTHYWGGDWRAAIEGVVISKALLTIVNNSDFIGTLKSIFDYLVTQKNINGLYELVARNTAVSIDDILKIRLEMTKIYEIKVPKLSFFDSIEKQNENAPVSCILHYLGEKHLYNHRRFRLNKYLNANFSDVVTVKELKYSPCDIFQKRYKAVLVSFVKDIEVINCFVKYCKINNVPLFYDRTDNWSALDKEFEQCETLLIQNAKTVFCSARFLQEDSKKRGAKDTRLILNGCDIKEFTALAKYKRKTAIYIGVSIKKVDYDLIQKLAKENPAWDFVLYIRDGLVSTISNIKIYKFTDEDTIFDITRKCHIGLIPFVKSEWTRGMLPLKLFQYANAHIPTAYSNCPECDYYRDHFAQVFDLNSIDNYTGKNWTLDRILECNEIEDYDAMLEGANWSEKFKEMTKIMLGV